MGASLFPMTNACVVLLVTTSGVLGYDCSCRGGGWKVCANPAGQAFCCNEAACGFATCMSCPGPGNPCGGDVCPVPPPGPTPPPPCEKPLPVPSGKTPALQQQRPPQQTPEQAAVVAKMTKGAAAASAAAEPWVRSYIESMRPKLAGLPCANATTDVLLAMLTWEFRHLALLHNGPLVNAAPVADDTNMVTTLTNGYLQSVAQRYVMGVEPLSNLQGEGHIMTTYLGFPPFQNPVRPTLREANRWNFYLANNMQKNNAGNFQYGEVTYVRMALPHAHASWPNPRP